MVTVPPPQPTNLTIQQGATWIQGINWADSNNNTYNLTGYTVKMQARANYNSPATVLDIGTSTGEIVVSSTSPNILITIPYTITSQLRPAAYVYDIKLTSPGNVETRLIEGEITVTPQVTL